MLPLHPHFIRMCEYYNLTPFQFVPNEYRYMAGMYILYHKLGFNEPSPEEFIWFYQLKVCSDEGYFYTSKCLINSLNGVYEIPDNMGPFEGKFFFTPCQIVG